MTAATRLKQEVETLALYTALFAVWFLAIIFFKYLILVQYEIEAAGVTVAFVTALVLAKVVLLLEHVELGEWVRRSPAWLEVALRTLLYGVGVLIVLLLEKSFEARHEAGGFLNALAGLAHHPDIPHVIANTLCVTAALLLFNMNTVLRRNLGPGAIGRMFLRPLPPETSEP